MESSQRGLKLGFRPHLNQRFAHKVMGSQSCESLGTKCHLDMGLVKRHKIYYKGEGGGFPQVRAVVNLMNPNLLVARLNTKSVLVMQ